MCGALGSASCDITHETGVRICYGQWVLRPVSSHTRQWKRYVTGIGFCVLRYHTRDRRYDLLYGHWVLHLVILHTRQGVRFAIRALGSASCVLTHETGGTSCYGQWVLRLVLSHRRQGVRFDTGFGFCVLCYHTRDRATICDGNWVLSVCDITHETGGTICYGQRVLHWVLRLVIPHTRQGVRFVIRALGSASCDITHETRGYDLLRALGSAPCDITDETEGTICYGHWVLRLVTSHTKQGYDLLRALGSASCDNKHETGGTSSYRHWVLPLVISHKRQGCDLLRALGTASCDITHETGGTMRLRISHTRKGLRYVTGLGFCVLRYHTRDRGYDLLRALGSAFRDITYETGGTICSGQGVLRLVICYVHWVLGLVILHTRQGVRCVTGIGFFVL